MPLKKMLMVMLGLVAAFFCGAAIIISGMFAFTHSDIHVPQPPAAAQTK
jgi:hypothetical protein